MSKRKFWHKNDEHGWHEVELHDIDGFHAIEVDPDHWAQHDPRPLAGLDEPEVVETEDEA